MAITRLKGEMGEKQVQRSRRERKGGEGSSILCFHKRRFRVRVIRRVAGGPPKWENRNWGRGPRARNDQEKIEKGLDENKLGDSAKGGGYPGSPRETRKAFEGPAKGGGNRSVLQGEELRHE